MELECVTWNILFHPFYTRDYPTKYVPWDTRRELIRKAIWAVAGPRWLYASSGATTAI